MNTSTPADTPWLTPVQAAKYLSISLGTLRNWTSANVIPFARRRRLVRYHRTALDQWLSAGVIPPTIENTETAR